MKNTTYSKISVVDVLKEGEDWISGEEFLKRAKEITKGTMNQETFDYYSQKENWHLLPTDYNYLYFVDTDFLDSNGNHYVRFLYRGGAVWNRCYYYVGRKFHRICRVARLASKAEELETENSFESLPLEIRIKKIEKWIIKEAGFINPFE